MGDSSETRNLQKDSSVMEALRDPTVSVLARVIWFSLVKGLVSMIHANPMTRLGSQYPNELMIALV